MKKTYAVLSTLALSSVALVGCSVTAEEPAPTAVSESSAPATVKPEATEKPAAESNGTDEPEFAFATGMTFGKVTRSGEPSKELKAFLEASSEAQGEDYEDVLQFWTVKIDNREGFEDAFVNGLFGYDEAGKEYTFIRTLDLVEATHEALPDAPENATAESAEWKQHKELFELYSAAFESEQYSAKPGAVKEFTVVTGDELPSEFAKMTIDLGGLVGEADVITLEDAESQGYALDF